MTKLITISYKYHDFTRYKCKQVYLMYQIVIYKD